MKNSDLGITSGIPDIGRILFSNYSLAGNCHRIESGEPEEGIGGFENEAS